MKYQLDIKPLSVNKAFQGRRFKTRDYEKYRQDIAFLLHGAKPVHGLVEVGVVFTLTPRAFSLSDIDNFLKPLIDGLVDIRVLDDDRYIRKLVAEKRKGQSFSVAIEIKNYHD